MPVMSDQGHWKYFYEKTGNGFFEMAKWRHFQRKLAIHIWDRPTTFLESEYGTEIQGTIMFIVITIVIVIVIVVIVIITTSIVGTYRKMWDIVVKKLETAERSMPLIVIIWIMYLCWKCKWLKCPSSDGKWKVVKPVIEAGNSHICLEDLGALLQWEFWSSVHRLSVLSWCSHIDNTIYQDYHLFTHW